MGIKKAKTKEIKVVSAAEVPQASAVIEKLYAPEKNKQGHFFDGDPKAAAAKLVEKLRFEARVI
jgi:electron transfer flavoprotein beta subunit